MSHLRPEDAANAHRKSSCKKGRHRYGESQNVGGGIARQVCLACGAVTIDLTAATDLTPIPKTPGAPSSVTKSDRQDEVRL